jgi:hypothetical protein
LGYRGSESPSADKAGTWFFDTAGIVNVGWFLTPVEKPQNVDYREAVER